MALTGERSGYYGDFQGWPDVVRALGSPYLYTGQHSASRDRRHGREPAGTGGENFVVCLQNHDQVGNRARGERLSRLTTPPRLRVAALLLLTSPYVPLLFAGEEWAASTPFLYFSDHEPELGRRVTAGPAGRVRGSRLGPGRGPRSAGGIDVHGVAAPLGGAVTTRPTRPCWTGTARLIRLRREHPGLGCGDFRQSRVIGEAGSRWVVAERGDHLIGANLGPSRRTSRRRDGRRRGRWR